MATFSPNSRHRPTCCIFLHIFKQIQEKQTWTHVSIFCSRLEICLSGLFFLFYIMLEMIIILFRWRLGSSTCARQMSWKQSLSCRDGFFYKEKHEDSFSTRKQDTCGNKAPWNKLLTVERIVFFTASTHLTPVCTWLLYLCCMCAAKLHRWTLSPLPQQEPCARIEGCWE